VWRSGLSSKQPASKQSEQIAQGPGVHESLKKPSVLK
jgi:hypothetical protein